VADHCGLSQTLLVFWPIKEFGNMRPYLALKVMILLAAILGLDRLLTSNSPLSQTTEVENGQAQIGQE
jgi:hypothetical protein